MSVSNQLWTPADLVPSGDDLLKQIVDRRNMVKACNRVVANEGNPGGDKMSTAELPGWLQRNIERLLKSLLEGSCHPQPVRLAEIDKPGGGKRELGIPTVTDRIAQMVVKMTLEPELEPFFHSDSYGYRPGKSAIEAVGRARERCWRYNWVIDLDIKGFFDNLRHDLLLKALQKHTTNKWVLLYVGTLLSG